MSWASILTALGLAIVSAELVLIETWEPWRAFLVVGIGAVLVIIGLLALLLVSTGQEHRQEVLAEFVAEMKDALGVRRGRW